MKQIKIRYVQYQTEISMNRPAKNALSICLAATALLVGPPTNAAGNDKPQLNGTAFALKLYTTETKTRPDNHLDCQTAKHSQAKRGIV
jgi:hypothetical protein